MPTPKSPKPGNSFAESNSKLAKEWHPTKNGDLTPFDVSRGSKKKVWWKCEKGSDHEWEATVANRSNGSGCSICRGLKVVFSNSLQNLNPRIAKQWHPTLNGSLKPTDITPGSDKKVWWKCPKGNDHEWEVPPSYRTGKKGTNCPFCSGSRACKTNNLKIKFPLVSKEWHPTLNGEITPNDVTPGTTKKVWWKCPKGDDHEWEMLVVARTYDLDGRKPQGCPVCAGKKIVESNCLETVNSKLAREWHSSKNGDLTPKDVGEKSGKKVWWKCNLGEDHEWQASVANRSNGRGCPICNGKIVAKSTALSKTNPELVKEWHPKLNVKLTPSDVVSGSQKKVWWICSKEEGHEWISSISNRVRLNRGCPYCTNQKINYSNSLESIDPRLAKQWHPTLNGTLKPSEIAPRSNKKVWWKCPKGDDHEWKTSVNKRANGRNCPFCDLTPQSREELTITFELIKIFKNINPKGHKLKIKGKLRSIDIFLPHLSIGIEFDGSYWHKDKREKDKMKTLDIEEQGINIIRVRQKPLKRIFEDDVMAEKKFDGKQITNDILKQIMKDYDLDKRTLTKIDNYIAKEGLQNQKGLDKYIDQILTEKAERKKNT